MDVCSELGLNVIGYKGLDEGFLTELRISPEFGVRGRTARLLQLYKTLNDERYPNWAGLAVSSTNLEHTEMNLEVLKLSTAQDHLMKKFFDETKLERILRTGKAGITIMPVGNR